MQITVKPMLANVDHGNVDIVQTARMIYGGCHIRQSLGPVLYVCGLSILGRVGAQLPE